MNHQEQLASVPVQSERCTTEAIPTQGTLCCAGFWNDLPLDEERIPLPAMKPHYGKKELARGALCWLDLGELTLFLGILYTTIGCTHLVIMFLNWSQ